MEQRSRVQLPPHVQGEIEVYVNGIRQREGVDFERRPRELVFARSLEREGRLGPLRWLSMLLGIAGTYRRNDSVDIVYDGAGRREVATGLPFTNG